MPAIYQHTTDDTNFHYCFVLSNVTKAASSGYVGVSTTDTLNQKEFFLWEIYNIIRSLFLADIRTISDVNLGSEQLLFPNL